MVLNKTGLSQPPILVTVAGSVTLAGPNPGRITLVLPSGTTNRYTIGFGTVATLDQGITIPPNTSPMVLAYEDFGDALQQAITAISAVADQVVAAVDIARAP